MKKLFYMISAVALMASFASCNKIEQENTPVADGTTTLTVSATVPQTKTNLSNGIVRWSANDVIAVLAEGYESVMSSLVPSACETHDFSVQGWYPGVTPQYAAFTGPYTSDENYDPYKPVWNEDGTIRMTVRGTQPIFNEDSFSKTSNISVGVLTENEGVYSTVLKNVCGLIKFTLTKPTQYVAIEDVAGKPMAGKVNVSMIDGVPQAVPAADEGKIYLTSKIKDSNETLPAGTYYAVVIPGTYTPKVTITPAEGEEIVLTAKSSVEIKRNEYVDFGTIDKSVEDEPIVPSETKTITLDFSAGWPLSPELAKYVKGEGPQIAQKTTYTLTQDDATYSFEVYSTGAGYYNTGTALRLSNSGTSGYITTPAIPGFKLTGADVTVTNTSGTKNLTLSRKCTVSEGAITVSGKMELIDIDSKTTKTGATSFSETAENTSYYLYTASTNYQLGKLILTYTKVN